MLNPDAEVNRLRNMLMSRNIDLNSVDTVCDAASSDINEAILTIVSDAMVQAAAYAAEIGADEFIDDIDLSENGGAYSIVTQSGNMDYSVPEIHNLPNLLKNGKMSKDGNIYKVIPLKDNDSDRKMGNSIFDDQQAIQSKIQAARESLRADLRLGQSQRTSLMTQRFRNMIKQNMPARKSFYNLDRPKSNSGATTKFATASSKQDPTTSWVIPAKDLDMTGYVMDVNNRMQQDIQDTVVDIINAYERMF